MTISGLKVPAEIKEHEHCLRDVLDNARLPLQALVAQTGMHLDEVFGYVCADGASAALITVVPLARKGDFLDSMPEHEHKAFLAQLVDDFINDGPCSGRLRTIVHTADGMFQVLVQLYPGAMA